MSISRALLRAARTLATFVLLASAAACGGNGEVDLPDPAPPRTLPAETPPPDLTAEEQQAVDEVRALVDEFLTAYVEILTAGEPGTDSVLARLPPLNEVLFVVNNEIVNNFTEERRVEGQLEWEFREVVEVDLERLVTIGGEDEVVPRVMLRYCVDSTAWQTVDKNTGEPVQPGEPRLIETPGQRHLVTVGGSYYDRSPIEPRDNPVWQVGPWENEEDQLC